MINIYDTWVIQIDVTNICLNKCAHCTRAVRHFKEPYFADLDFIDKALRSLRDTGWEGNVGCIGGEPTLHPKFPEICELFQKYFPRKKSGLWTCGGANYKKYKKLIDETFGIMCYNEHKIPSYHQPMLVASEEVIKDEKLRNELIDKCWLQNEWSPAITIKGAFFCEVAATLDMLFDGPGGYDLETKWWDKSVEEFKDQRDRYCKMCSIAIPMHTLPDNINYELISKNNFEKLKNIPSRVDVNFKIIDKVFTREELAQIEKDKSYRDPKQYTQVKNDFAWWKTPSGNRVEWYMNNLGKKDYDRRARGDRSRLPLGPKFAHRIILLGPELAHKVYAISPEFARKLVKRIRKKQ